MIDFIPIKTDTIYVLTHAEAEGPELTEAGKAAAEALVERLAPLDIDGAFSAPSAEAQATIEPLAVARGLTIAVMPDLADHRLSLQGNQPGDPFEETRFEKRGMARPGGERFDAAAHRLSGALQAVSRRPVVAPVVVTHPGLLAALLSRRDRSFGYREYLALPKPGLWKVTHDLGTVKDIQSFEG